MRERVAMGFHHVAFASKDTEATHRFYTEAMGFSLEKVVVGASPEGGWAKHFFFDTGRGNDNGMIAFWELHDASHAKVEAKTAISKDLGLPGWVNHLAFDAATLDDIAVARDRWLRNGYDVVEIDHEFCVSIYTDDPNGILVEFCCTTREFDDNDRTEAQKRLLETNPTFDPDPKIEFHMAAAYNNS
ncbi:MAG: VOC family protein [Actinobacteria bacterium]|nr:VOC family protein [Actinomycetota bacterium]